MLPQSRDVIREIDRRAIEEFGIPGHVLMENAGAAVARSARAYSNGVKQVTLVCGTGNNGGDGFVAARHLCLPYLDISVFILGKEEDIKGDARFHYDLLKKCPVEIQFLNSLFLLKGHKIQKEEFLWVDCIFGTGLTREVEGLHREVIDFMNDSGCPTLAVDIPSGLDADTGKVLGTAIKAYKTLTFVRPKLGFEQPWVDNYTGGVRCTEIGIPETVMGKWIEELESGENPTGS